MGIYNSFTRMHFKTLRLLREDSFAIEKSNRCYKNKAISNQKSSTNVNILTQMSDEHDYKSTYARSENREYLTNN